MHVRVSVSVCDVGGVVCVGGVCVYDVVCGEGEGGGEGGGNASYSHNTRSSTCGTRACVCGVCCCAARKAPRACLLSQL